VTDEKKRRARRTPDEIAADHERRAARIRHAGTRKSLALVEDAITLLAEVDAEQHTPRYGDANRALAELRNEIEESIPEGAR